MTGFGSADGTVLGGRLRVEIRTVNHRYYNPQLKLVFELGGVEGQLRERLRQLLERGHVVVTARWVEPPPTDGAVAVDLARARQVVAAAHELKKKLKLKGEIDLGFVARQPDVLSTHTDGAVAAAWSEVEPIVAQAAQEVLAMRAREGRALATDLTARLAALEAGAAAVAQRAPARLAAELARLKQAVAELAAGVPVDEQRLAVEIALLADRVDITEELVRLCTHLAACREALGGEGAVGKQLGFLAQELLREVNTLGSKANDATMTQTLFAMKGELEKFREQLENLECRRGSWCSPPLRAAAKRPSPTSCAAASRRSSGTRCPRRRGSRVPESATGKTIISSRARSSSAACGQGTFWSGPSTRESCTARCRRRWRGFWPAVSTSYWTSK